MIKVIGHRSLPKMLLSIMTKEAFKKIFAEPIEFVDEKKSAAPEQKVSLAKDEQIKKISSTTVTSEELAMLIGD